VGFFARMFLGRRRFPADQKRALELEGVVLVQEALNGSVTYRHYRRPGSRSSYRKEGLSLAIALTDRRLLVIGPRYPLDVEWAAAGALEITPETDGLRIAYDAEDLFPDQSGRVELFLHTEDGPGLATQIHALRSRGR
jgi:hypothetical protein